MSKNVKNPIQIIRTPEKINEEYSQTILKLGSLELELGAISKAKIRQNKRTIEIEDTKKIALDRIEELSQEMDEAQKEIKRKSEEAKVETTTSEVSQ